MVFQLPRLIYDNCQPSLFTRPHGSTVDERPASLSLRRGCSQLYPLTHPPTPHISQMVFSFSLLASNHLRPRMPIPYSPLIIPAVTICVKASVVGVMTADSRVDPTST